jgi:type IV pilus assembly protein PilB
MKKRLGDILVARGVVVSLQLQSALAFQRQWGLPLGQVVVDQGFASAEGVFAALEEQTGLASVDLDQQVLDPRLARLVPLKVAEARKVVPLRLEGVRESTLVVALAAPASLDTLDLVKTVSGKSRVVPRLATDGAIRRAIARLYRGEMDEVSKRGDPRSVELPEAEEVMAFMNNCMIEDVVIDNALFEEDAVPAPTVLHDGLPLLTPLELEPAAAVSEEAPPQWVPWEQTERVLVYGWGEAATFGLLRVLEEAGIPAREASTAEVRGATADMVIISPLPSMEALGQRVTARVLVAGKAPEEELKRSKAVGALGFLAAPVDPELLVRAVRRLLRLGSDLFSLVA